jgi:hypothetical protein
LKGLAENLDRPNFYADFHDDSAPRQLDFALFPKESTPTSGMFR